MSASNWTQDKLAILLDFTGDIYRHSNECIRNGNIIDYRAGIQLPWAKRSDLSKSVKERIKALLAALTPELFSQGDQREVFINFADYPTLDSAVLAIKNAACEYQIG